MQKESVSTTVTSADLEGKGIAFSVFTGSAGALSAAGHHLRFNVTRYAVEFLSVGGGSRKDETAQKSSSSWFGRSAVSPPSHSGCDLSPVRVTCEADGLSVASRISKETRVDVGPLSKSDKSAIDGRTVGRYVLEAAAHPTITFAPHAAAFAGGSADDCAGDVVMSSAVATSDQPQTQTIRFPKSFSGDLTLKGVTRPITCSAALRDVATGESSSSIFEPAPSSSSTSIVVRCPILQSDFGMAPFSLLGGALAVRDLVEVEVSIPTRLSL